MPGSSDFARELGDKVLARLSVEMSEKMLAQALRVYKDGMTREQFDAAMFGISVRADGPGDETVKAPEWAHDALDAIWSFVHWLIHRKDPPPPPEGGGNG